MDSFSNKDSERVTKDVLLRWVDEEHSEDPEELLSQFEEKFKKLSEKEKKQLPEKTWVFLRCLSDKDRDHLIGQLEVGDSADLTDDWETVVKQVRNLNVRKTRKLMLSKRLSPREKKEIKYSTGEMENLNIQIAEF